MDSIKRLVSMLDHVLDSGRKRHIVGGILLSSSIFFGGLALTALTLKSEEISDEQID